jgi:hypothetical protein
MELGKVFADRVLHDAIELSSFGLAAPVRIWTLPTAGDPSLVADEEMGKLQTTRDYVARDDSRPHCARLIPPLAPSLRRPTSFARIFSVPLDSAVPANPKPKAGRGPPPRDS